MQSFCRQTLRLNGVDGQPLLFICPDMPPEVGEPMLDDLQCVFQNSILDLDSEKEEEKECRDPNYQGISSSIHFVRYNRYSTHVSGPNIYCKLITES